MGHRKPPRPITERLRQGSWLVERVQDGLRALSKQDRGFVSGGVRSRVSESLHLDEALRERYPGDPRWDYLLGDSEKDRIVALEVHPATGSQVKQVIAKKRAAMKQLAGHLTDGLWLWFWAASGKVGLAPQGKYRAQLEEAGIHFVGRMLQEKDLDV